MPTYHVTQRAREAADQIEMLMAVEGQPVRALIHDTGRAIEIVVPATVPDHLRASPHVPASVAVALATHAGYVQWARKPGSSLFVLCDDKETFDYYEEMLAERYRRSVLIRAHQHERGCEDFTNEDRALHAAGRAHSQRRKAGRQGQEVKNTAQWREPHGRRRMGQIPLAE